MPSLELDSGFDKAIAALPVQLELGSHEGPLVLGHVFQAKVGKVGGFAFRELE